MREEPVMSNAINDDWLEPANEAYPDWQGKAARWAQGSVGLTRALQCFSDDEFADYLMGDQNELWADLDGFLQTRLYGTQAPFIGNAGWPEFERFCQVASLPACVAGLCSERSPEGTPEGFELRRCEFVISKILKGMESEEESSGGVIFAQALCQSGLADDQALAHYCVEAVGAFLWKRNPLLDAVVEGFKRLQGMGGERADRAFLLLAHQAPWTYDKKMAYAAQHVESFDDLMKAGCPFPMEALKEFFKGMPQESGEALKTQIEKIKEWMFDSGRVGVKEAMALLSAGGADTDRPGWLMSLLEQKTLDPDVEASSTLRPKVRI